MSAMNQDLTRNAGGSASVGGQIGQVADTLHGAGGEERIVIPLVEETITVAKRQVERGGVRLTKTVEARDEQVPVSLQQETVSIERVPIGQYVDVLPTSRQEGDTLIIPVFEEVVVTRILLKEELRITRQTQTVQETHTVTLRREKVQVERLAPETTHGTDNRSGS